MVDKSWNYYREFDNNNNNDNDWIFISGWTFPLNIDKTPIFVFESQNTVCPNNKTDQLQHTVNAGFLNVTFNTLASSISLYDTFNTMIIQCITYLLCK